MSKQARPKLIIGTGTGRCGTMSLAHFLDSQGGTYVSHEGFREHLPWEPDFELMQAFIDQIYQQAHGCDRVGNVSFYWQKYIGQVIEHVDEDARIFIIERPRKGMVDSWLRRCHRKNKDHFTTTRHQRGCTVYPNIDKAFPKYPTSLKDALGLYWDEAHRIALEWRRRFPHNVKIIHTDRLNTERGRARILDWAQIPESQRRPWEGSLRINTGASWRKIRNQGFDVPEGIEVVHT